MDGEGDSDGSSSGEHQLPSTPRKRGQTINTYTPAHTCGIATLALISLERHTPHTQTARQAREQRLADSQGRERRTHPNSFSSLRSHTRTHARTHAACTEAITAPTDIQQGQGGAVCQRRSPSGAQKVCPYSTSPS
jgi:hypothetical protein